LDFQELFVVVDERNDSILRSNIVDVARTHCMVKIQVYPLADVEFVLVVPMPNQFDNLIRSLADFNDYVLLSYLWEFKVSVRKRQINNMHKRLNDVKLSHEFLPHFKI